MIAEIKKTRTQFGFTSMGCPQASFSELIDLAREWRMEFIELRALGGTTDLPGYFSEHPVPDHLLPPSPLVRLIASELKLIEATDAGIARFLDFVKIAGELGAPYVRVFGGNESGEPILPSHFERAAGTVRRCREAIADLGISCELLLETHSSFSSSRTCLKLNEWLGDPLHILWDSHHTWRNAGETPPETWNLIGPLVRHIHFSDSRLLPPSQKGHRWVMPGEGEYPMEALRQVLSRQDYAYGVSLEWEKLWHPELPAIPRALAEYRRLFELDAAASVSS